MAYQRQCFHIYLKLVIQMSFKLSDLLVNPEFAEEKFNRRVKIPIFILVDNSGSMIMNREILFYALNKVFKYIAEVRSDLDVFIMPFNDEISFLKNGGNIEPDYSLDLEFNGSSRLGFALVTTLDSAKQTISNYLQQKPFRQKYYSPVILVFSDGQTNDSKNIDNDRNCLTMSIEKIKSEVMLDRLHVISFAIGNECNYNIFRDITGLSDSSHVIIVENGSKWFDDFENFSSC